MKKLLGFAAVGVAMMLLAAPFIPQSIYAAEFIAPQNENENITLSSGETHKNVYIAGGSVFINSDVAGDLYGVGGTMTVEGKVEQDVVVAGGTITLNSPIGGDVRVAGGTVVINGPVGGDVIIGGGTVHITEKASVQGDLAVAAGDLILDGTVVGFVKIGGGVVTLNSSLPGQVTVAADQSLTIGSKAVIPNTIVYKGIKEAVVQDGAQIGTIDFQAMQNRGGNNHVGRMMFAIFSISFVIKSIGLILAALLLMKLFPRTAKKSVEHMQQGMWKNLGIGLIGLIVTPILFFILLITFFGMYIAFLLLFAWLLMLIVASLVASVFVGAWIINQLTKKQGMVYDWQALVIGVVVLGIVMIIPFIGSLVFLILMLMAFGGIIRQLYAHIQSEQTELTI